MIRGAALSIFLAGIMLSNATLLPTRFPAPTTVNETIAILTREAAIGRAVLNITLALEVAEKGLEWGTSTNKFSCYKDGILNLTETTANKINAVLELETEVFKGINDTLISDVWNRVSYQIFGRDGINGLIRGQVKEELHNIKKKCENIKWNIWRI